MMNYWYCKTCKCEVDSKNVTFQEMHDLCGTKVWVVEDIENSLDEVVTVHEAMTIANLTYEGVIYNCKKGNYICRKSGKTWLILKSSIK